MKKSTIILSSCLILLFGGFVGYKYLRSDKAEKKSDYTSVNSSETISENDDESLFLEPIDAEEYLNEIGKKLKNIV